MSFLRAKDRQVFAFRVGDYMVVGPVPDAKTKSLMIEIAEENDEDDEC